LEPPAQPQPIAAIPAAPSPRRMQAAPSQPEPVNPPPKPDSTPQPQSSASSGVAVTLEQVVAAWKKMILALKREHPQLEALLLSSKTREVIDGALVIGFASDVLASKMNAPDMMEPARQALREALGFDIPIRTTVATGSGKAIPSDVKPDGMVATATQIGGEIVDIQ